MDLTKDRVQTLAALAKLALEPEEVERLGGELEQVVAWMAWLGEAPKVEQEETKNVLREDAVEASMERDRLLSNAPEQDGAYFIVPRAVDG